MINNHYNVAVIGGGPAGMMAAGRAAQLGARVVLVERNEKLGKKLLLTGKGRCNITKAEFDMQEFANAFGKKGKFLYSALANFGVEATIKFFNQKKLPTVVERDQRVFPKSGMAEDVLDTLVGYLAQGGVELLTNASIKEFLSKRKRIKKILFTKGELSADVYIVCTGGLSWPSTGSRGEGFRWAEKLGHTVVQTKPALVPVIVKEDWVSDLEGLSLRNVAISVWKDNKKQDERFGEALFTDEGMSGPIVIDMSKKIGELLKEGGELELRVDLKPALSYDVLDQRVQRDLTEFHNKMFRNSLEKLLPQKLIPVIVELSEIDEEKKANSVTKEERSRLIHLLKEFKLTISKLAGFERAIITAGGISLDEIDPRTMRSRLIDNLFFAGEIIDLDGPTGGYNLQLCWSTGYLAGESAARSAKEKMP